MKVRREPRKMFSPFINDAEIIVLATIVFANKERTTLEVSFPHAARGLTKKEMSEHILAGFKMQEHMLNKVTEVIIK